MTMVNRRKRVNPDLPIVLRAISAIDFPPSRMLAKRAVKSCTAPMKMPPRITHSTAGTKPYTIAKVGPMMGPAPAMLEKW